MLSFIPNIILLSIFIFILLYATYYRYRIDSFKWKEYKPWDKIISSGLIVSNIIITILILLFLFDILSANLTMVFIMLCLIFSFLFRGIWWRIEYLDYVKHTRNKKIMLDIYKKLGN